MGDFEELLLRELRKFEKKNDTDKKAWPVESLPTAEEPLQPRMPLKRREQFNPTGNNFHCPIE